MALSCILYYVASALLGGLLSWLLFGGKSGDLDNLRALAQRDKAALQSAITELNNFKNQAKAQISSKESEISKLKKSSALPDIITKAQEKEIKHWKQKAGDLEAKLKQAKKSQNTNPIDPKTELIELELETAYKSLEEKNNKIEELEDKLQSEPKVSDNFDSAKDLKKLKKKLKNLKKKLKAQKKAMSEIQTIEIKETLDIDKLRKLLAQGKLTNKTKKVSKKKAKKSS